MVEVNTNFCAFLSSRSIPKFLFFITEVWRYLTSLFFTSTSRVGIPCHTPIRLRGTRFASPVAFAAYSIAILETKQRILDYPNFTYTHNRSAHLFLPHLGENQESFRYSPQGRIELTSNSAIIALVVLVDPGTNPRSSRGRGWRATNKHRCPFPRVIYQHHCTFEFHSSHFFPRVRVSLLRCNPLPAVR